MDNRDDEEKLEDENMEPGGDNHSLRGPGPRSLLFSDCLLTGALGNIGSERMRSRGQNRERR